MDFKEEFGSENKVDNKNITHYVMGIRSKMIDDVLAFNQIGTQLQLEWIEAAFME